MGAFNTLTIQANCNNCGGVMMYRVQFKFGEVWQYEYKLGDKIKRAEPYYDRGKPNLPRVICDGALENNICPHCNYENPKDCDIIFEYDIIKGIKPPVNWDRYDDDGCYIDE
ncbi:hypothetical protein G7092_09280 [Mucilaginibacter sp. HC2]|uniref:hypothetical protein n=1 Tax=Mucilaginibacter inviolabilis TaxID=2714892 RepID=UPI00140CF9A2|nr:hypothetical protein [Mucilaginibacter inviolabilis]NHA03987.1 hypothetical protein [Mucilaginibacter inviolabilis]